MLKKNLLKKVSSAMLTMCFLVCLDFGCLAMYPNAEKNPNEDEFGISTEDKPEDYNDENEIKRDSTEGYLLNGLSIEYLVKTITEEANRALKNGKAINDVNETEDKFKISTSDESVDELESNETNGSSYKEYVTELIRKAANKALGNEFGISTSDESEDEPEDHNENETKSVDCLTNLIVEAAEKEMHKKELSVITPNVAKKVLNEDQIQNEGNHNKFAQTVGTYIYSDEDVSSLGSEDENE